MPIGGLEGHLGTIQPVCSRVGGRGAAQGEEVQDRGKGEAEQLESKIDFEVIVLLVRGGNYVVQGRLQDESMVVCGDLANSFRFGCLSMIRNQAYDNSQI